MSAIVLGKFAAIEQPQGYRYDPVRGDQTTRRWRGPKAKIIELLSQLRGAGATYDCFSNSGAVWEVIASFGQALDGSTEAPIDVWDSFNNRTEKDILDSSISNSISPEDKRRIRNAVSAFASDGSAPSPAFTGAALTVYDLMTNGITSIRVNAQVVRHTQIVSNNYAVKTSNTNNGRIVTTASIAAPSTFLLTLPSSGAGRTVAGGFNFGWYKNPPQVQTAAYNKVQIIQEWEYGEWSVFEYGALA